MFDPIWESLHRELEWGKYPSEEVVRFVARNYYQNKRDEVRILDMGCGSGAISWYLALEGFEVYGFDGSKTAIEKVEHRFREDHLKGSFKVADALDTGYPSEFFDGIIDSAMIYANKVKEIEAILKEAYRITKPGGRFFSTGLFCVGMKGYGTGRQLEESTFYEIETGNLAHRGTAHFFEKEEILQLWSDAGFQNLKLDYVYRTDKGGESEVKYFMVESEK